MIRRFCDQTRSCFILKQSTSFNRSRKRKIDITIKLIRKILYFFTFAIDNFSKKIWNNSSLSIKRNFYKKSKLVFTSFKKTLRMLQSTFLNIKRMSSRLWIITTFCEKLIKQLKMRWIIKPIYRLLISKITK